MGFLDRISDEQLYFLACLIMFIGLILAIYLGNEFLEWAAMRREKRTIQTRWAKQQSIKEAGLSAKSPTSRADVTTRC